VPSSGSPKGNKTAIKKCSIRKDGVGDPAEEVEQKGSSTKGLLGVTGKRTGMNINGRREKGRKGRH